MCNMFRYLRADEIDARVGTAKDKGVSLLLYKDARCDMAVLDETVGPFNWKREHSRDNANCTVSIWDEKKGQWISKEDTGTESNTEAEKGLASDSFKRACFNWGIGRELYTAPFIWIPGDGTKLKYERFKVTEIGYDGNGVINRLQIVNKAGSVVYEFPARPKNNKSETGTDETRPEELKSETESVKVRTVELPKKGDFNARQAISVWCIDHEISMAAFTKMRQDVIDAGEAADIPSSTITEAQLKTLLDAVERRL